MLLAADWLSFVIVGFGTLFLIGELFVNMKGFFGLLGIAFISVYFLSYLDPSMFFMMILLYFLGILFIVIDGKLLNDGTLATIGALCMIVSVGITAPSWVSGTYAVIGVLIGGITSLVFLKVFPKRRMWTKLALLDRLTKEAGYSTMNQTYEALTNKIGIAVTDMHPVGTITIDGTDYSAISGGQWIPKNSTVIVKQVDGTKILVSKVES
ncbi:NfeD family protein [Aquibacillus salsiterrae]|uniref:Nodulation protein NfeD n=1 Tax=Aquibacillus salsiterrae TaxID=2950439 RepID=A0A9X3WAG9_9BACI|nr:NfeD family protein [Aquibacillus salsiterrae]MDC3415535.1 nodulation protein NfeD [Aquibacillus salsiterrae]